MKMLIGRLGLARSIAVAAAIITMVTILAVTVSPASDTVHRHAVVPVAGSTAAQPEPRALAVSAPAAAAKPAAADTFVVRRILKIDKPLTYGDWYWDEAGVPAGRVVITVDLAAQVLSVFRDGYEIGTSVIIYGDERVPTPTGRFPILMKDANHFSATYDHAPMPYTLRLTKGGVSIHGSEIADGNVTHGCIGLPKPFARLLFNQAHLGDLVIVTNGQTMNLGDSITHG
jgi:lipoprotein-anchoring transpeptidase ErfK/SrfK